MINRAKYQMEKMMLHELADLIDTYQITRPATDGTYNPVTETTTGGTNGINETIQGILRKPASKIVDGINITNDDMKLTIIKTWITFEPKINDTVDSKWRVIKIDGDAASMFYNLYLRAV